MVSTSGDSRLTRARAELYLHDNTTVITVPTGTEYTHLILPTLIKGEEKNAISNTSTGELECTIAGVYNVVFTASSKVDVNQLTLRTVIFKNELELQNIHAKRVFKTAAEETTVQIEGFVRLDIGDKLTVRGRHNDAGDIDLTIEYGCFKMDRIDV